MKLFYSLLAIILVAYLFAGCATYNNHITGKFINDDGSVSYTVSPSWKQALHAAKASDKTLFWVSNSGAVASFALSPLSPSVLPITSISFVAISGSSMEWYKWNSDRAISKAKYDSLLQANPKQSIWEAAK